MPVLKETEFSGEIVWLGHVAADGGIRAQPVEQLQLGFGGVAGARHEGEIRPSCVRVKNLYPQGTEIRNVRQLTILSQEEMSQIARAMEADSLDPRYLGASVVVKGIPDFTHIPPSSRLQGPDGATLTADMENRPCVLPGREIEKDHTGMGPRFKPAAEGRRGITAWVERPGRIRLGEKLRLFVPDQRVWMPQTGQ